MRTKVHRRLRERREREEGAETHAARAARSTSESARFYNQGVPRDDAAQRKVAFGKFEGCCPRRPNRIEPKREAGGVDNGCTLPWKVNNQVQEGEHAGRLQDET